MGDNRTASLRTAWLVFCVLCVSALVLVTTAAGADPTPAECDLRVNDTPSKLIAVHPDERSLEPHAGVPGDRRRQSRPATGMPSRNSGEPGYKASADYVAKVMKARRLRRDDPDVQVRLLRVHRRRRRSARCHRRRTTTPSASTGIPGRAPGPRTRDAPAGRRHRHPADADRRARRAAAPRPTSAASCRAGSR